MSQTRARDKLSPKLKPHFVNNNNGITLKAPTTSYNKND